MRQTYTKITRSVQFWLKNLKVIGLNDLVEHEHYILVSMIRLYIEQHVAIGGVEVAVAPRLWYRGVSNALQLHKIKQVL